MDLIINQERERCQGFAPEVSDTSCIILIHHHNNMDDYFTNPAQEDDRTHNNMHTNRTNDLRSPQPSRRVQYLMTFLASTIHHGIFPKDMV